MEILGYLVVNWISVEQNEIIFGATDYERWGWDLEAGMSGADARTCVWVTLTKQGKAKNFSVIENVSIFCPELSLRPLIFACLPELVAKSWEIAHQKLSQEEARKVYFGMKIFA